MFRRFGPSYMLLLYVLDLGCSLLALVVAQRLRLLLPISPSLSEEDASVPLAMYASIVLIFGIILPMANVYNVRRVFRAVDEVERVVLGVFMSSFVLAGTLYLSYREVSRWVFLYFAVVAVLLLLGYRVVLRLLFRILSKTLGWTAQVPAKVLIAGAGRLGRQVVKILPTADVIIAGFVDDAPERWGTQVEGLPVLGDLDAIPAVVKQQAVTDIIFALPRRAQERLANLLVSLWKLPLRVYTIPDFFDLGFARTQVEYLGGLTVIGLREPGIDGFQHVAKRLIDVVLGTIIFVCALPIMAIIAVGIRLDSPGPILFKQQRVGENGRLFTMYKFRTMVADAERRQEAVNLYTASGRVIHKRPDDPRVTRVGRLLRHLSLDELPQLFNVLRGDMSLVGPRPELPWIVAQYEPWQYQRLAVPQGMTSWYVVNGRSEIPMHLNTEEDLQYIRDYSLFQDLKILWKSVAAVLKGRGAI